VWGYRKLGGLPNREVRQFFLLYSAGWRLRKHPALDFILKGGDD